MLVQVFSVWVAIGLGCWGAGGTPNTAQKVPDCQPLEGFTLPYEGDAEVSVIDGGWLIIGLTPADARPVTDPALTYIPDREWFFLVPSRDDVELVRHEGRTWYGLHEHSAAVLKRLGETATRIPVPPQSDACARQTVFDRTGTAKLTLGADGTCHLHLLDDAGAVCFTATFDISRPPPPPQQPAAGSSGEQSTSCQAECDNGDCSITCIGKMALCDCRNGDPECRCGRTLSISPKPPIYPAAP